MNKLQLILLAAFEQNIQDNLTWSREGRNYQISAG